LQIFDLRLQRLGSCGGVGARGWARLRALLVLLRRSVQPHPLHFSKVLAGPSPLFPAVLGWWIEDRGHEAQISARSSYWAGNRLTGGLGNVLAVGLVIFLFFYQLTEMGILNGPPPLIS
jgi:hypothetical protein